MKKKIIALLAGATAIATVGGSFAAWDVLGGSNVYTVTFENPAKVDITFGDADLSAIITPGDVNNAPKVSKVINVTVPSKYATSEYELVATVSTDNDTNVNATINCGETLGETNACTLSVSPKNENGAGKAVTVTTNIELSKKVQLP